MKSSIAGPSVAAQEDYWDKRWHIQSSPNDWQTKRSNAIMAIANRLPLDNPKILDLGCGTGFTTRSLSDLGVAEGIDLSPKAIDIATAEYPGISFRAGDLYDLDIAAELYDLVVCQEVIPHVTDQSRLLKIIADSIKPRGYLIITAASKFVMDRMTARIGGPIGSGPLDPSEHIKKWLSIRELSGMMRRQFHILKKTSLLPMGDRGILRIVNSYKVNQAIGRVISPKYLESLKCRLGFGYTIIILGQKRR